MNDWLWVAVVMVLDVGAYVAPRAYARFWDSVGAELADAINYSPSVWLHMVDDE